MSNSVWSWGSADVAAWLRSTGEADQTGRTALDGVARRAEEEGVDGPTLLELDAVAWEELGVQSAVLRILKVRTSHVSRLTHSSPTQSPYLGSVQSTLIIQRWMEKTTGTSAMARLGDST